MQPVSTTGIYPFVLGIFCGITVSGLYADCDPRCLRCEFGICQECPRNKWGWDCERTCGYHCRGSKCFIRGGDCIECEEGYIKTEYGCEKDGRIWKIGLGGAALTIFVTVIGVCVHKQRSAKRNTLETNVSENQQHRRDSHTAYLGRDNRDRSPSYLGRDHRDRNPAYMGRDHGDWNPAYPGRDHYNRVPDSQWNGSNLMTQSVSPSNERPHVSPTNRQPRVSPSNRRSYVSPSNSGNVGASHADPSAPPPPFSEACSPPPSYAELFPE